MFESLKTQLWDILKKKDVSLVMIFDKNGDIHWHKGRKIEGKSIHLGLGFSRSAAHTAIKNGSIIEKKDVEIVLFGRKLPESAVSLSVRSLIVIPGNENYFLYIDSGTKDYFTETDIEVFRVLGQLLGNIISQITRDESDVKGITGSSDAIKTIREMVLKFSLEEEPVLLTGETGVGKSHIAELIHRYSGRKGKFVVAEITGIHENLFESTLFGHKKGAFTDAHSDQTGLVQEADGGTMFIDEVFDVPVSCQAKLLRFIETKKYRVLGESSERLADVRIVAATNKNLQHAMENNEFREDLYYRLHVLEIEIPPLRQRKEDIKAFIDQNRIYLKGKTIGAGFWDAVLNHDWPGNMRELITVMKRAGILLNNPITGEKIKEITRKSAYKKNFAGIAENPWAENIREALENGQSFWEAIKEPFLKRDLNRKQVKELIANALLLSEGSYKESLKLFNLPESEYGNFMKFLYRNFLT